MPNISRSFDPSKFNTNIFIICEKKFQQFTSRYYSGLRKYGHVSQKQEVQQSHTISGSDEESSGERQSRVSFLREPPTILLIPQSGLE
mmetsp:Transcript_14304/g.22043  ORF Transcript_14304/g.22043 Transcript_14304/m.22043 type:complete len:88 (-) Transcript_14304:1097-1360(-)